MTIKHEIKIDKENKVLTLMVSVPRKKIAKEEDMSFRGADAWELVKDTVVEGYKVEHRSNGLIIDNWRLCNHNGSYTFSLVEDKLPKSKAAAEEPVKKSKSSVRKSAVTKDKE